MIVFLQKTWIKLLGPLLYDVKVLVELILNGDVNLSGFIKNIFICVSKMNESLKSLHQNRGLLPDPNPWVPKYFRVSGRVRVGFGL